MTETQTSSPADWAELVARGYADEAAPPLTPDLLDAVRETLRRAGLDRPHAASLDADAVKRANEGLDAFELELGAVVGPRLAELPANGRPAFVQRSEAGRPLRAYGGQ
ncbi:hypothetical protein ASF49_13860 [Methylobacterium sp. Leaf104]|uniref:hypothetical protein n=1 Tax=Methylobacterium TaxID=407 RepID=UPI000701DA5C|nr:MULTISPECIES: hypothetical protein [Methylobacterium]KQP30585.1 hypothetical protein ASF49_13860 [Methylobacterium sp. Leaf104]MCI9882029.1 hypothetical protein [Methylobacterium goesingense]